MLKTKSIEEVYDMDVFTDSGEFFGVVEELQVVFVGLNLYIFFFHYQ